MKLLTLNQKLSSTNQDEKNHVFSRDFTFFENKNNPITASSPNKVKEISLNY